MTGSSDDPLERMRAADPAAGQPAPDHARVRAAVTARLAAEADAPAGLAAQEPGTPAAGQGGPPAAGHPAAAAPRRPGEGDELARRRRRQPLHYAAAAVAAVLLLGGGYALGADGSAAGSSADQQGAADSGAAPEIAPDSGPDVGTAPEASSPEQTGDSGRLPSLQRPVVFTAGDLGSGPAQAHAWSLALGPDAGRDRAGGLAAALGLSGEPWEEDGTWVVGEEDGGPLLRLYPDGSVDYADPDLQATLCEPLQPLTEPDSDAAQAPSAGDSTDTSSGAGGSLDCSDDEPPTRDEATTALASVLDGAGLDAQDYELQTTDAGSATTVIATLVVDSQPSPVTLSATVTADGIAAVWGNAATPADLGEYALVSPAEAVQRLSDPRFATGAGTQSQSPGLRLPGGSGDQSTTGPVPPVTTEPLAPGSAIPWPVQQVQITTAELTLVSVPTSAGLLLLPGYTLTGTDGSGTQDSWSVPAVATDDFDFTS